MYKVPIILVLIFLVISTVSAIEMKEYSNYDYSNDGMYTFESIKWGSPFNVSTNGTVLRMVSKLGCGGYIPTQNPGYVTFDIYYNNHSEFNLVGQLISDVLDCNIENPYDINLTPTTNIHLSSNNSYLFYYSNSQINYTSVRLKNADSPLVYEWDGFVETIKDFSPVSSNRQLPLEVYLDIPVPNCTEDIISYNTTCGLDDLLTQYSMDLNNCSIVPNITYSCDYCTPEWEQIDSECFVNDTLVRHYEDNNSCYAITGLISDYSPYNDSWYSCDYCQISLVNSSWSEWVNVTTCQENNVVNQERSLIEYDINYCGEFVNITHYEQQNVSCDYCTPNYIKYNTTCLNGIITEWVNDTNSCNEILPLNTTYACINNATNISLNINGTDITQYTNLTGVVNIEFKQGNNKIIEFSYNYSNGIFNYSEVVFDEGSIGNKGYVIVKGIELMNQTKTLYMNKFNTDLSWVCIKDADIDDISEISPNCQGTNEYKIQCNNVSSNGYKCEDLGIQYKISGLHHSGIIQTEAPIIISTTENRHRSNSVCNVVCSDWSECNDGIQTRDCKATATICSGLKGYTDRRTCQFIPTNTIVPIINEVILDEEPVINDESEEELIIPEVIVTESIPIVTDNTPNVTTKGSKLQTPIYIIGFITVIIVGLVMINRKLVTNENEEE